VKSKGGLTVALVLVVGAMVATPAQASSRAEWVGQVDQLCLAAQGPEIKAALAYFKALKRFNGSDHTKKDSNRFIRASAKFLGVFSRVETNLNSQIQAIPPPTPTPPLNHDDGPTIAAWLQGRAQAIAFLNQGIVALKHHHARAAARAGKQFDAQLTAANALVADFGFQHCV
jgi:hypothetical protein